jgi:hypothetical protein
MATGDKNDFLNRLQSYLPRGWFGDLTQTPVLNGLLSGLASVFASMYALLMYFRLQARIATATDGWLDIISADFLGSTLPRRTNESDTSFRNRIVVNIFRQRTTRAAVIRVLTDLTGRAPTIVEPQRPSDTGAYRIPTSGYGVAGAYGSLLLAYQAFVTAYRPIGTGIPYVAGYGSSPSGYSVASRGEYADLSMVQTAVSDADIYAAIASVLPVATIAWSRISN